MYRLLAYVEDYTMFTVLCVLVRGVCALGATGYATATFVFVINAFPNNIGTVIVSLIQSRLLLAPANSIAFGHVYHSSTYIFTPLDIN